jgi:hypothetical protein
MAVAVLAGLWFARSQLMRAEAPTRSPDGAAYLREIAPMLRRVGCARNGCHGDGRTALRLSPEVVDAADAVREFHEASALAGVLYARATGEGHRAVLRAGSCEAEALRAWAAGRAPGRCQSGGPQRRVVR